MKMEKFSVRVTQSLADSCVCVCVCVIRKSIRKISMPFVNDEDDFATDGITTNMPHHWILYTMVEYIVECVCDA